jgi:hypothetical protein
MKSKLKRKPKLKRPADSQPLKDRLLERIMRKCGTYYHSADFFYHELWRDRLRQIGFRVIYIERIPQLPCWRIRLCGSLAVQAYLLVTKPMTKARAASRDPLLAQLKAEVREIAADLGRPMKNDEIELGREGAYFTLAFIWPPGKPGMWLPKPKRISPFSLLIRPWLRRAKN